jgi:hypothetical protein
MFGVFYCEAPKGKRFTNPGRLVAQFGTRYDAQHYANGCNGRQGGGPNFKEWVVMPL